MSVSNATHLEQTAPGGRGGTMPKAQKKGGGAKAKTEEEKLLYLQQKAQAEEEAAKKKEELLTLFLKDKLQKEQKNTALNLLKLNEGWRTILRQSRAAELRKERDVHTQMFERQMYNLDSVIESLQRSLWEAEHQSAQACSVNLHHLEHLRAQQERRLTSLQGPWVDCVQQLSSRFSSEREQMLTQRQQHLSDLHDAVFTVELQHKDMMKEIDRLRLKNIALYESAIEDMRAALALEEQGKLKKTTLRYQQARQLFDQEAKELDHLVKTNEHYRRMEDTLDKRIKKLQELIVNQKTLNFSKTDDETVERDMRDARNEVNKNTQRLRSQLLQDGTTARNQLTDLTLQSNGAAKKLREVINKGERFLRVAEICRKLESEQENIFTSSAAESQRQERPVSEEDRQAKDVPEFPELRRVVLHINNALLHREALRKEKEDLSRENQQLRLLLRQHLDAMTVSEDALNGRHALLTVHQAPTTTAPADAGRRHTVIEAVHVVKHSL
ncbi:hypothetical protein Q5P01_021033 [Channa striata]|uniref:Dynein regulatory complex subunit 2 n=1 Tax=Channa striata TaxID=64152 RepID=A0AA88LYN1_CHASR|nr:hypothetical protein Q5P01_021033 [Channa striata]